MKYKKKMYRQINLQFTYNKRNNKSIWNLLKSVTEKNYI